MHFLAQSRHWVFCQSILTSLFCQWSTCKSQLDGAIHTHSRAQHNITSKTDKVCQTDNIVAANKGKTGLNALHKLNKHRLAIYRTSRTTFAVLRFTHKSIILNFILNYFYSLLNLDLNSKAFMQGLPSSVYTWRTLDTATEFGKIHRSSLKWTNIL